MSADLSNTVAGRIALALKRHDVSHIFAQSLPSAVILAAEALGIRQVAYRQENMGGAMADGYARRSGKVGVVAAQNGPAATLLVPPLAEALKASIPIVALVQDVERNQADRNAFQELDHLSLFQSCTKWARKVVVPERIEDYIDTAFAVAGSGRPGPTVLVLPADLLRSAWTGTDFTRTANLGHWPIDRLRPSDQDIAAAARLLSTARLPVVIAGGGVHASGASGELSLLQDECAIPVFTTFMGKGAVDEFHELSAGVLGSLVGPSSLGRHSLELLKEADVVLLVGTRTNQNGTDSWTQISADKAIIHIDVDPAEVGRTYEARIRLVGDATETLRALRGALCRTDLSGRSAGRVVMANRIGRFWSLFNEERRIRLEGRQGPIRPERVMVELQAQLTPETTVVADASYSSMWVCGQLRALSPGMRFLTPRGLAGLGWGIPLAIGAKVARPDHPVVVLVGDGGFAHSWAELETMVRSNLPITIVVLNNGILGFQRDAESVKFGAYTSACHLGPVDHAMIAKACGCSSVRLEAADQLADALRKGLASKSPFLIEVMTDPAAHPPLSLFATVDAAA
ncbi:MULTISPECIES: acetolactate synthase catalytic subunit [unclassified Mesorhizobium]|uniref:acetolactate synthase catalytic subunit n=1 Tax=unclassified Mesorhizobium TaxID=325217 RepID=UPI001CCC7369|nr:MULTISPECIES: acetolactate synthase catalytic subunit [unclassified Mesorhizobium]MBZ9739787.1 acetolactate synthase catalytic subunit [Mesorhizobium sp. CO1-1-4]MBZ9804949.1 acetolactate synthase catalytic subunit [Mesorhizobium sp. ES1-6]